MKDIIGSKVLEVDGLEKDSTKVTIVTDKGVLEYLHYQNCCESVFLEDFEGSADQLIGAIIVSVETVTNLYDKFETVFYDNFDYSNLEHEWTFYKIETNKGGLWMRWLGESNGYYSMEVSIEWTSLKPTQH